MVINNVVTDKGIDDEKLGDFDINFSKFDVTEKSMRQSSENCTCFYCGQEVNEKHKQECELVCKKVKIRAAIEYYITVPSTWSKEDVEHYRNNVQCADIAIHEIANVCQERKCLCGIMKFEYAGEDSEPYIDEEFDIHR